MSKIRTAQNNNGKYTKLLALMTIVLYASSILYAIHRIDDITLWISSKIHVDITLPWELLEFRIILIAISVFIFFLITCSYACILSPIEIKGKTKPKIIVLPEEMR